MYSVHVIQRSDLVIVSNRKKNIPAANNQTCKISASWQTYYPRYPCASKQNCPVSHIGQYLNTGGPSPGPPFILPDRSPISRAYFASQLTACLSHAGYHSSQYKCHSFRIGSATTSATRGFTVCRFSTSL